MKVKSQFYDDASGSTGRLTWANGNGGLTMKNKPIPKNPKSQRQEAVRRSLAVANTKWTAMSNTARSTWEQWGKTLVKHDRLGNKIVVNGWSAFSGAYVLNTMSTLSDTKLLVKAPEIGNYSSAGAVALTRSTNNHKVVITNNGSVSITVMIFQGPETKPTINVNKWGYQYHDTRVMAAGAHADLPFAVGTNINYFFRLVAIDDTGRHSLHNDQIVYFPK